MKFSEVVQGNNLDVRAAVSRLAEQTKQAKMKDTKPKSRKPPKKGNTSPHPYRGKMVGEDKAGERDRISKDIDQFLQGGGKIDSGRGMATVGRKRNVGGKKVTVNASKDHPVQESPLVTRIGVGLEGVVKDMFDDFMSKEPNEDQLRELLRIMGKTLDIRGKRAVIDQLRKHGFEESGIFEDNDPCWKNYRQVGTKTKTGKKVPNCVPKEK